MISYPLENMFGHTVEQLENIAHSWTQNEFIGTALWETHYPFDKFALLIEMFRRRNIKVTLILNSWSLNYPEHTEQLECDVIFFDYWLWKTYNEIVVKKKSLISTNWNSDADKFLFLTGKPQKPNRIRLLYKFTQQLLLERCTWSLFVHSGNAKETHSHVKELDAKDFEEFVKKHSNNPDLVDIVIQPTSMHYGGIPYDVNLFTSVKFRVIAETDMSNNFPWLTEKTWITILNRLPFIVAGDINSNRLLRQMGFRTFDHCVPDTTYDDIRDVEQRLDKIVDHTKLWLNKQIDSADIAQDVEHNHNRLISLATECKYKLEQSLKRIGIRANIDDVISTLDIITNK